MRMVGRLLVVIVVSLLVGAGATLLWDRPRGLGIGIHVAVVGVLLLVLRRNRRDLPELEQELAEDAEGRTGEDDIDPTRAPPNGTA